jgi:gluconolactonase
MGEARRLPALLRCPANIAYRWKQGEGITPFLNPSGLAGPIPAGIREAGSNGLGRCAKGRLIIADSGTRAIAALDLATKTPTILADRYQGKRFNSCNDVAFGRVGAIYFTDPPYGLTEGDASPLKELAFNGVFRLGATARSADRRHAQAPQRHRPLPQERPRSTSRCPTRRGRRSCLSAGCRRHAARRADRLPRFPRTAGSPSCRACRTGSRSPSGRLFASGPGGIHVLSPPRVKPPRPDRDRQGRCEQRVRRRWPDACSSPRATCSSACG